MGERAVRITVYHGQRNQPGIGPRLDIGPERAEMMRIPQRHDRSAAFPDHGPDVLAHGLQRRLGEAVHGVNAQIGCADARDLRSRMAVHPAAAQGRKIAGDAKHAMAEGAIALATRAVPGKDRRRRFGGARLRQQALQAQDQQIKRDMRGIRVKGKGHHLVSRSTVEPGVAEREALGTGIRRVEAHLI
nr:hypothetical protein [Paracoccus yeei]